MANPGLTGQSWEFDLPQTVPLSLNDRRAWQANYQLKKSYREAAHVLARAARIPKCQRIRVYLVYTPRDVRRRDPLNLVATLKAVEDGIVDAGIVPDDTPMYLESQMPLIDMPEKLVSKALGVKGRLTVIVERVL